ncbi:MAG: hypothetical protein Q8862_05815 [Bacteroidota bacterium]|nr:hypothetical protein [Bacteroidota bacterium]MDP4206884.1 hypothetical protein [Bacteroidota bacterium]
MRRTRYINRMGTLLFLLILVVPGAFAQRSGEARFASRDNDRSSRNNENRRDRDSRNDNFSRNNGNDKSVYYADNDHRERHGKKYDNDERGYNDRHDGYRERRDYREDRGYRFDNEPRGHAYGHYKKAVVVREYADRPVYMRRHECFRNPQYGWVVTRFASEPVVIRERDWDCYYSDGTYYRYYPRVGYVVTDAPYDTYVNELPDGCRRVRVNGEIYFSLGNMFFSPSGMGFRMVHPPVGNLSFSFRL